ncbi:MAG: glycoside hydrolase, partial [Bacteroidota bacterium]
MNIKFLIPLVPFVLMTLITFSQTPLVLDFNKLNNSHDLSLPSWGPYSKTYAGISHIHDVHSGIRFDFSVAPGFYRNKILVPNVQFESGYFPWHAANDLSQYTYRYELEWKDKVFVDVTYTIEDSASVMVSIRCVNNTPISQNLSLNLLSTIAYADPSGNYELANVNNSVWIRAVDYEALSFSHPRPKDNLVTDGWMRGEIRSDEFIDGCALGRDFGKDAGDQATYAIEPPSATGMLSLIYRMKENDSSKFRLSGAINADIKLAGTGKLTTFEIPYQSSTEKKLTLHALGGAPIELNGLLMTAAGEQNLPIIQTKKKEFSPQVTSSTLDKELVFKYKDIPTFYGLKWSGDEDFHIRQIKNDELDIFFKRMVHNHVTTVLKGNSNGEYQTVYLRPVFLEPQSEKTISVMLVAGGPGLIKAKLGTFESFRNKNAVQLPNKLNPEIAPDILPEGEKFNFSQKMLKATVLTDVVYPIYTQRDFIRHFTPGKWWNSLYTWD